MTLIRLGRLVPPDPPRPASEITADKAVPGASAEPPLPSLKPETTTSEPATPAPVSTGAGQTVSSPAADPANSSPAPLTPLPPPPTDALGEALREALGTRYDLLRPIAIGGMAVLFQLRHRLTGGLFVAKIMRPELVGEAALRDAFTREARVGAQLAGHPNAVPVLDLEEARLHGAATPFLLMPYIDGEDLDHVLERGPLGRDEALMMLAQLASLLMFAETERLVHADVALGNIRLDRFGAYRLLDYGLARHAGDAPHTLAGTPAYNSPEQLRGERLDIRSDLYSLGLVFFHALTGRAAFATTDLGELERAHLDGAWHLPAEFAADPALAALLRSLLAVDREQRMASAFELSGAMSALGYELPSFLRSLPGASPTPKLRRRRLAAV